MQIYPEAEPFTHLAKVPFGVKQYTSIIALANNQRWQDCSVAPKPACKLVEVGCVTQWLIWVVSF